MKNLIVYYSRKGENYYAGAIKDLTKGNTEIVAEIIQKTVDGVLFEVETIKPYSKDYNTCVREAQIEFRQNSRPELKKYLDSIEIYKNIFIGFPNWWGTMPMAMFTFLERYDFSGKNIIPFCTSGGSGLGQSEKDLVKICKNANVKNGLAILGSEVLNSEDIIISWAKKSIL